MPARRVQEYLVKREFAGLALDWSLMTCSGLESSMRTIWIWFPERPIARMSEETARETSGAGMAY